MSRASLRTLALVGILPLAVTACGGQSETADGAAAASPSPEPSPSPTPAAQTPPKGTVIVELTDFEVQANPQAEEAGRLTFDVRNDAEPGVPPSLGRHNLVVLRTDLPFDSLPLDSKLAGQPVDTEAPGVELVASLPIMDGGAKESLTTKLEPGSYVLICNLVNHYILGMRAEFSVD